jgi:hypothetical protein
VSTGKPGIVRCSDKIDNNGSEGCGGTHECRTVEDCACFGIVAESASEGIDEGNACMGTVVGFGDISTRYTNSGESGYTNDNPSGSTSILSLNTGELSTA